MGTTLHRSAFAALTLALTTLLSCVLTLLAPYALAAETSVIEKVNVATETELRSALFVTDSARETIVLTANLVLTDALWVAPDIDAKIDLKGHTLSRDLEGFEEDGHVVRIESGAKLAIVDTSPKGSGKLIGGRAIDGGGIYNEGTLNLTGATLSDCKAEGRGGGIYNAGTATITSTWIEKCEAAGGGGIYNCGIAAVGAKYVQDNTATELGGGILNDAKMTLTRCTVRRNGAWSGAGIANRIVSATDECTLDVSGSTITANTAEHLAGGIYATRDTLDAATEAKAKEHKGCVTLMGATKITNNTASLVGGLFSELGHSIALKGATVTGNTSTHSGWYGGSLVAGGITFIGKANETSKEASATFALEGKNVVKNNTCTGTMSNVTMSDVDVIEVTGAIEAGSSIGLTPPIGPIWTFTTGYGDFNEGEPSAFFFTQAKRSVKLRSFEAALVEPVPYIDEDGNDAVTDTYSLADESSGADWYGGDYVAYSEATIKDRVTCHGEVRLILRDGVSLTCSKGIELPSEQKTWATLTVLAQSAGSGTLTAEGGSGQPGIGSKGAIYGRFIQYAGNVNCYGGKWAAGIGGGDSGPGDSSRLVVEVKGGTLVARGTKGAAGIGCGTSGNLHGSVTVSGGDVTAIGSDGGAGIGGASNTFTYIDAEFTGGVTLAQSNKEGASAVGEGIKGAGFSVVTVGDAMSVHAAGGNVDAHKRVATCMSETSVIIEPCTHKATDMEYIDDQSHLVWCRYCGANRHEEAHQLAWDHTCPCGYASSTYKITYDPAGGRGETYVSDAVYANETLTLESYTIWQPNGLPPSGKFFLCWEVDGEYLDPGDTITMTKDVTARAVWTQACRVTFRAGDGRGKMNNVICAKGSNLTLPEAAFQGPDGKGFVGWKMGDALYAAGETVEVTGNLDFVAQWGMNWRLLQEAIDAAHDGDTIVLPNDVQAADGDVGLQVRSGANVTIDLAGHTIDRHLSAPVADGYCILVTGTLRVMDTSAGQTGLITGANNANKRQGHTHEVVGGGIVVDEGTLTLEGATIAGNKALDGAGVLLVTSGSVFHMNGGAVSGNVGCGVGAGVCVAYGSVFSMAGGSITDNVIQDATDGMPGEDGAGVYAYDTFEVEGEITIADNTGAEGRASNVYLANTRARIKVTGALRPTVPIGVITRRPSPVTYITQNLTSNGRVADFVADDPTQVVAADGDEAVMRRPLTLTFDPGDEEVEGEMEPMNMAYGLTLRLPTAGFVSRAHRAFRAWSIGGVEYAADAAYYPRTSVTATALWDDTFEVSFDPGDGTGDAASAYVRCGATYALPEVCPFVSPAGRGFCGWEVAGTFHEPGDEIQVDGPLTAVAAWDMDWAGLQELLDQEGDIDITLPHDIVAGSTDGPLTIREDKTVTIDLAGHTLDRKATERAAQASGLVGQGSGSQMEGAVFDLAVDCITLTIRDSVGGGTITGASGTVFDGGYGWADVFIEGGAITGNHVYDGICGFDGTLVLSGGEVSGNQGSVCGGIHVGDRDLEITGGARIYGNTASGKPSNVRLSPGATILVEGLLSTDEPIGVSSDTKPVSGEPTQLTTGFFGYGDEGCFVSEQEPYLVCVQDDEAYLAVPVTVTIENNGGVGAMEIQPQAEGMRYPLPACTLRPPLGRAFDAWLCDWHDGSEPVQLEADEWVVLTGDLTLTALWVEHEHVLVAVPAKQPTCTEDGWIAHWACAVTDKPCGLRFADAAGERVLEPAEVSLTATGHVPASPVVEGEVEPTCNEGGSCQEVTFCTVCGEELSRTPKKLDALGHDWDAPTYEWTDDLSTVTASHVCRRDASHTESETVETEPYPEPIGDSAKELVTFVATFENPAFGSVSRQKLIETAGSDEEDDDDDDGDDDDGGQRDPTPSVTPTSLWPLLGGNAMAGVNARRTILPIAGGLAPYEGGTYVTNDRDRGAGSSSSQTPATTAAEPSVAPDVRTSASAGEAAAAPQTTDTQQSAGAQPTGVTQQAAGTQTSGTRSAEAQTTTRDAVGAVSETASAPLATTADASLPARPVALLGALVAVAALIWRLMPYGRRM